MLEMDDDQLTALALREHAQTCDDIAQRYVTTEEGKKNRQTWQRRAERCRALAEQHERRAKAARDTRGVA